MKYVIMNKNNEVARFLTERDKDEQIVYYSKDVNILKLPYKLLDLIRFLKSRSIVIDRYGLREDMREIGINNRIDLISLTYGVSMVDTYWIKRAEDTMKWEHVSPYNNNRYVDTSWYLEGNVDKNKLFGIPDYSIDGNFPKCWVRPNGKVMMVKCGTSGAWNAGLEPLSEILFTQIAEAVGLSNYVHYSRFDVNYSGFSKYKVPGIVKSTIDIEDSRRFATVCECFTNEDKSLVTASELGLNMVESIIKFAMSKCDNWKDICLIYLADCLGFNEDRHLGNIGFLYNSDTYEITSVAPMYDNNLSLLCYWDDRIDLDEYVEQLSPASENSFEALFSKVIKYVPEAVDNIIKIRDSFEFRPTFEVLSDRAVILSKLVRSQADKLLKTI
jgi:hypothetical protein